ncbi:hypothetical protein [Candidatus Venteria ishoeyi]|uniref:Uncharacterized protein n=1 Tax=Candidatus Venteria ishoeyi TaxID=1899563 RepID=A0A1H6FG42_9GAMM|nr:hypothetical protein [Candidatus Venteria ishoeyi]SEH08136.1 Uncharacterised protein [Candidatus Venteria ishoeyi]
MDAVLRLFNAIQVENKQPQDMPESVLARTLKNGYVLDPAIHPDACLLETIERIIGFSGEKANAAFHKSWKVIQESSIESLVVQQLIHYVTTYGFESLGLYQQDRVYIPHEKLAIPALKDDIPLIMIKAMDANEILNAIIDLASGIALSQATLDDMMAIVAANAYQQTFIEKIQNRELKALLYDHYGIVPSDPEEFLRHLLSKLTDESLLIKNNALIEKIKSANGKFLDELLKNAPDNLAAIFFRFKPLFLAMKSISRNKSFFNRLRKQAKHLHRPLPVDYLNSVTAQIKQNNLDLNRLAAVLNKAPIFRKIRLAYALNHRLHAGNAIVYRVRNGRGWATEFDWSDTLEQTTQQALDTVLAAITDELRKNLENKLIYIPEHVHYALPATEKQFTGNLPTGTYVAVPQDLIVGIHWVNSKNRVDLDLSAIGLSGKTGWDAAYRSDKANLLFSGDMTDAPPPHGASELFYIKKNIGEAKLLMVNYFNFNKGDEVRMKILAAREMAKKFGENYMVNPNNIVTCTELNISKKQNVIGLIVNIDDENRMYFANISIGNSITASHNPHTTYAREYLFHSMVYTLDFRTILRMAGASVLDEKPEDDGYIDLSPEALDKTTIINLINASGR